MISFCTTYRAIWKARQSVLKKPRLKLDFGAIHKKKQVLEADFDGIANSSNFTYAFLTLKLRSMYIIIFISACG